MQKQTYWYKWQLWLVNNKAVQLYKTVFEFQISTHKYVQKNFSGDCKTLLIYQ